MQRLPVSVAIPTYGREKVLLDTIDQFLAQDPPASEILIMDQTPQHEPETLDRLKTLDQQGKIRWFRLSLPSQPAALNRALVEAVQPIVLFLDDDIRIVPGFVQAHFRHYSDAAVWAVAGQVLQPGETERTGGFRRFTEGPFADCNFPFSSATRTLIQNGMSGNLSVLREKALQIGGFDEQFVPPVSYRFDNDFCKRLHRIGGKIVFEPAARIYHLRAERGGTRSQGNHLVSASPLHGVGDYYFALKQGIGLESFFYMLRRPFREVRTRFHLTHPWWIPVKFFGEIRAFWWAMRLFRQGPKLIGTEVRSQRTED